MTLKFRNFHFVFLGWSIKCAPNAFEVPQMGVEQLWKCNVGMRVSNFFKISIWFLEGETFMVLHMHLRCLK